MSQPNNTLTKHVITQNPQKAVVSSEQLRIQELITEHIQQLKEKEEIISNLCEHVSLYVTYSLYPSCHRTPI